MATITFKQTSLLSAGGQSFSLASLLELPSTGLPAVLAIRAYDRDVYSAGEDYNYGSFSSPKGGSTPAGTAYRPTVLYFDLQNGHYVARATGEDLADFQFHSSAQNFRSVYLSAFTSDKAGATLSDWIDPAWGHANDLDVVTRTNYVDATPNHATPEEIAALAKGLIGQVWNSNGCWLLASNVSAAAGASLPVASAFLDNANITGNGQWQLVYNGATQTGDWRALLQPGDMVELGWVDGKAHIATVTSGSGHGAMWVDNSGVPAGDGDADDILIQGEHSVDLWTHAARDSTVIIFRLNQDSATGAPLPAPLAPPVVTPHALSAPLGSTVAMASLFTVNDPNLLAMRSYRFAGDAAIALNGATNLSTESGVVIVSAPDMAKLTVKAALGPHTLTVTAFDGQSWGSGTLSVTGWTDAPPTVMGASVAPHATGQMLYLSTLLSATAGASHTISEYRFIDADHTGQLVLSDPRLNLATDSEAAQGIIRIKAADLNALTWRTLVGSGDVDVAAFDGVQWSDYATLTIAGHNAAPVITPRTLAPVAVGQAVPVASMFGVTDPDGDAISYVTICDTTGSLQLNGATDYCPFPFAYEIRIDELSKVTYQPSQVQGGQSALWASGYDGVTWSGLQQVNFTIYDGKPSVRAGDTGAIAPGKTVAASTLFKVADPDGHAISQYAFHDPAGGGTLDLHGAANLATADQAAQGLVVIAAAELGKLTYTAATQSSSEVLRIGAYDGLNWGWNDLAVSSSDGSAPTFFAPPTVLDVGRTVLLSSLVTAYAAGGRTPSQYRIIDPAGGGSVHLNGAANLAQAGDDAIVVSGADFAKLSFTAALDAGLETLQVSALDAGVWGQANLQITARDYARPVVTGVPATVHAGQVVSLADLFTVRDPDGLPVVGYQVNTTTGHLQLNGAVNLYAADQYKGFYGFTPADLLKVNYVAGGPGVDTLYVEAASKSGTSMGEPVTVTVLPTPVITAGTSTVGIAESLPLSALFAVSAPSGKSLLQVRVDTQGLAGSVSLNGTANLATADERAHGVIVVAAADLAKVSYTGASSFHVDHIAVSAWDGESWGSATVDTSTVDGAAPRLTAPAADIELNSTVNLASLFSAVSSSGRPITEYRFIDPAGGGHVLLNGAANLATAVQQNQQGMSIIAVADLAKVQYVGAGTAGSEALAVGAFDGESWGTATLALSDVKTDPPQVATTPGFLQAAQPSAFSAMFSVQSASGHAPTYYIIHDEGQHIVLNGAVNQWAAQQTSGYYWITAADIGKLSYSAPNNGVYRFDLIVNDGLNFSDWAHGMAVVGKESLVLPPAIAPTIGTLALDQKVPVASLFDVSDPIGLDISSYRLRDTGGGKIVLGGAVDLATAADQADHWTVVSAADLAKVQFQAAGHSAVDALEISAYDGLAWGSATLAVVSALRPPVLGAGQDVVAISTSVGVASLFFASSAPGSSLVQYEVQDPAGGGHVELNGAANLASAAQQALGITIIGAADLGKLHYVAPATGSDETLMFGASDGTTWGTVNLHVTTNDTRPPEVAQLASTVDLKVPVACDKLVHFSSPSGRPLLQVQIQDPTGGGQLLLNAASNLASPTQAAQGIIVVSAYDVPKLLYVGGTVAGSENLLVTVTDGETTSTSSLHIDSVTPIRPLLTPTAATIHVGDSVRLADLVSVQEANGHALNFIRVLDASQGVVLNGAVNIAVSPLYDYRGIYDTASVSDFDKLSYVGQAPGTYHLTIQGNDGFNLSNTLDEVINVVAKDQVITADTPKALAGTSGDDVIAPTGLRYMVDGGAGLDTVRYAGGHADYVLTHNADGSFGVQGIDGRHDTLKNVERLQFSDGVVALDTGSGATSAASAGQVFRLYQAAFDRTPDAAGLSYWMRQADGHLGLDAIAGNFLASAESQSIFAGMSDRDFVAQLYHNVLHRDGDPSGLSYWSSMLDQHLSTRAQVLSGFADSAENQAALVGSLQHGIILGG
ncbi:MAG: DUF4214 domain-containing protein [Pseudomonadota bacterium]